MPLVRKSIDPSDIAGQIKALKLATEQYQKTHAEWLTGRDIRSLEISAKEMVEFAKADAEKIRLKAQSALQKAEKDAEKIRNDAQSYLSQAKKDAEDARIEKKNAKELQESAIKAEQRLAAAERSCVIEKNRYMDLQANLSKQIEDAKAREDDFNKKADQLRKVLYQ